MSSSILSPFKCSLILLSKKEWSKSDQAFSVKIFLMTYTYSGASYEAVLTRFSPFFYREFFFFAKCLIILFLASFFLPTRCPIILKGHLF